MENDEFSDETGDETAEELYELRRKTTALWQQTEALQTIIEELISALCIDPNKALLWAERVEEIAAMRKLLSDDDAAIPWLNSVRERLLVWHGLAPMVEITSEGAKLKRPPLRERLSVVHGGLQTPYPPAPASPALPTAPFCEPPDKA